MSELDLDLALDTIDQDLCDTEYSDELDDDFSDESDQMFYELDEESVSQIKETETEIEDQFNDFSDTDMSDDDLYDEII